ncbi:FAD binding domain-containing protein [Falsiroseomonas stagni]|uniref:FAD binding domain-containing protein n=1 Tax=Falsiroseomonas stagni TaxID=484882 RepID=UPI000B8A0D73|nr:FAD binding domain-containing protein [Falsiroseomonas stagni]
MPGDDDGAAAAEQLGVKAPPFEWHRPATLAEAVASLAAVAPQDGRVLAGGQSLLPAMALRVARPPHLVDINGIAELGELRVEDNALRIGALVRHAAFHRPVAHGPLGALMAGVVRHIAHWPIRTRGSFGGSLCHADPASEWPLVAVVLGATMQAVSLRGDRLIDGPAFLRGPLETALAPDEILRAVTLPLLPADAHWGFEEVARRAGDFAQAMALVVLRMDAIGRVAEARIGIGGVEAVPRRLAAVEALVNGRLPSATLVEEAGRAAAAACDPMEDAPYRRALVRAVVSRALASAAMPQALAA